MSAKNRFFSIAVGVFIILIVVITAGWFGLHPSPLVVQGEVEATQIKVSAKIAGRIDRLHVKEGDTVTEGQVLVSIDTPEIRAKLTQAMAAQRAATAQQEKAQKGERKENIQAAYNTWMKAQAASELAVKTFERISKLHGEGVLPAQKKDEAEAQMKAAIETEKAAHATYEMATTGARQEDKDAARALVDQATGAVSEVKSYLNETSLKAPAGGEVSSIIAQEGELISPGFPIVNIVDLSDMWITFNLREDIMAAIRMGDTIEARFPALGDRTVKLKVTYINALGTYAIWNATKTSGDFDMKTFEVRARPVTPPEGLRPGMTALVNWDRLKKKENR